MSSNKQSNNGNGQKQGQPAGSTHQPVQGRSTTQPTAPAGGQPLWDSMNLGVGNPNAGFIDPRLVQQAVGPIPGVVPVPPPGGQQQQTARGAGVQQSSQVMQGSNPGGYGSQPPATNMGHPGQAPHGQGVRFRPVITPRGQQGQGGSAPAGGGGPPPAYGSGTVPQNVFSVDPFRNQQRPQDGSGQSRSGQGNPHKRRG